MPNNLSNYSKAINSHLSIFINSFRTPTMKTQDRVWSWTFTFFYYMASSASGQYAANSVFWLATRAGKMERYCPPGTARFVPANKILQIKFSFAKMIFCQGKKTFCVFSVFMEPEKASTRMKTKKTKMLMSFKYTFCNKNRQTQKLFWIWKFENFNLKFEFEM